MQRLYCSAADNINARMCNGCRSICACNGMSTDCQFRSVSFAFYLHAWINHCHGWIVVAHLQQMRTKATQVLTLHSHSILSTLWCTSGDWETANDERIETTLSDDGTCAVISSRADRHNLTVMDMVAAADGIATPVLLLLVSISPGEFLNNEPPSVLIPDTLDYSSIQQKTIRRTAASERPWSWPDVRIFGRNELRAIKTSLLVNGSELRMSHSRCNIQ